MKTFLEPLLHPYFDKWFRWVYTAFVFAAGGWNLLLGIQNLIEGDLIWTISLSTVVAMILLWAFMMILWASRDRDRRATDELLARRNRQFDAEWDLPSTIPVVAPEDASDPFTYAMMRAMQTGVSGGIYQDDNGVWRDSDTDEVIPVQGSAEVEAAPVTAPEYKWRCGKCEREEMLGYDDRQIPKHHRSCPKRKAH